MHRVLGARLALVPGDAALSAEARGAGSGVALDVGIARGAQVQEARGGAGRVDAARERVVAQEADRHVEVVFLERRARGEVAGDVEERPVRQAARLQAARTDLLCAHEVVPRDHGPADACLAHGVPGPAGDFGEVHDAAGGHFGGLK